MTAPVLDQEEVGHRPGAKEKRWKYTKGEKKGGTNHLQDVDLRPLETGRKERSSRGEKSALMDHPLVVARLQGIEIATGKRSRRFTRHGKSDDRRRLVGHLSASESGIVTPGFRISSGRICAGRSPVHSCWPRGRWRRWR
jgi:hypothetical protein